MVLLKFLVVIVLVVKFFVLLFEFGWWDDKFFMMIVCFCIVVFDGGFFLMSVVGVCRLIELLLSIDIFEIGVVDDSLGIKLFEVVLGIFIVFFFE